MIKPNFAEVASFPATCACLDFIRRVPTGIQGKATDVAEALGTDYFCGPTRMVGWHFHFGPIALVVLIINARGDAEPGVFLKSGKEPLEISWSKLEVAVQLDNEIKRFGLDRGKPSLERSNLRRSQLALGVPVHADDAHPVRVQSVGFKDLRRR